MSRRAVRSFRHMVVLERWTMGSVKQAWMMFAAVTVSLMIAVGGLLIVPMAAAASVPEWPEAAALGAGVLWVAAMIWVINPAVKYLSLPPDYREVARGSCIEVIGKKDLSWRDDYIIVTAIVSSEGGRRYSSETRDMLVPRSIGEGLELRKRYELQGSSLVPK